MGYCWLVGQFSSIYLPCLDLLVAIYREGGPKDLGIDDRLSLGSCIPWIYVSRHVRGMFMISLFTTHARVRGRWLGETRFWDKELIMRVMQARIKV